MSAMLEVADDLFMSLRSKKNRIIEKYREDLSEPAKKERILDQELNIDVLQAYMERRFGGYEQELSRFKYLLEEMRSSRVNLRDVEQGQRLLKEKGLLIDLNTNYPTDSGRPTQTGIVRLILDITNENFYAARRPKLVNSNSNWIKFVEKVRTRINK